YYIFLLISWFLISQYLSYYKTTRFERYLDYIRKSIFQLILFAIVLFAISGVKNEDLFSNKQSLNFIIILIIYVFSSRTISFFTKKWYRAKGLDPKKLLIIGNNQNIETLISLINKRKDLGINLVAHLVKNNPTEHQKQFNIETLKKDLEKERPHYI